MLQELGIQYSAVFFLGLFQAIFFVLMATMNPRFFYDLSAKIKGDRLYNRLYTWALIIHYTLSGVLFLGTATPFSPFFWSVFSSSSFSKIPDVALSFPQTPYTR